MPPRSDRIELLRPKLEQGDEVRGPAERIRQRCTACQRQRGNDDAADLSHNLAPGRNGLSLERCKPLEIGVVTDDAEAKDDALGRLENLGPGRLCGGEPGALLELALTIVHDLLQEVRMQHRFLLDSNLDVLLHNLCYDDTGYVTSKAS